MAEGTEQVAVGTETRSAEVFRGPPARFPSCYGQDATQEDIYDNDVRPLLDVLYNGVVSALVKFVPSGRTLTLAFTAQDCNDLCVWCHVFGEDTYDAR